MFEYADAMPEVWEERHVKKARKKHKCVECNSEISIAESYWSVFAVYDFGVETIKFCEICKSMWDKHRAELTDCAVGSLWEGIKHLE